MLKVHLLLYSVCPNFWWGAFGCRLRHAQLRSLIGGYNLFGCWSLVLERQPFCKTCFSCNMLFVLTGTYVHFRPKSASLLGIPCINAKCPNARLCR